MAAYGQGFAVGLEDAGVLATLFPRGTKPSEIGARLKTFQELRKLRAEHVSQMSTDAYKEPDEDAPEGCEFPFFILVSERVNGRLID
jgi:2-polyprenyl-6-methoxyphenol hydroxylase-like FAD-dependent oxidoreductase